MSVGRGGKRKANEMVDHKEDHTDMEDSTTSVKRRKCSLESAWKVQLAMALQSPMGEDGEQKEDEIVAYSEADRVRWMDRLATRWSESATSSVAAAGAASSSSSSSSSSTTSASYSSSIDFQSPSTLAQLVSIFKYGQQSTSFTTWVVEDVYWDKEWVTWIQSEPRLTGYVTNIVRSYTMLRLHQADQKTSGSGHMFMFRGFRSFDMQCVSSFTEESFFWTSLRCWLQSSFGRSCPASVSNWFVHAWSKDWAISTTLLLKPEHWSPELFHSFMMTLQRWLGARKDSLVDVWTREAVDSWNVVEWLGTRPPPRPSQPNPNLNQPPQAQWITDYTNLWNRLIHKPNLYRNWACRELFRKAMVPFVATTVFPPSRSGPKTLKLYVDLVFRSDAIRRVDWMPRGNSIVHPWKKALDLAQRIGIPDKLSVPMILFGRCEGVVMNHSLNVQQAEGWIRQVLQSNPSLKSNWETDIRPHTGRRLPTMTLRTWALTCVTATWLEWPQEWWERMTLFTFCPRPSHEKAMVAVIKRHPTAMYRLLPTQTTRLKELFYSFVTKPSAYQLHQELLNLHCFSEHDLKALTPLVTTTVNHSEVFRSYMIREYPVLFAQWFCKADLQIRTVSFDHGQWVDPNVLKLTTKEPKYWVVLSALQQIYGTWKRDPDRPSSVQYEMYRTADQFHLFPDEIWWNVANLVNPMNLSSYKDVVRSIEEFVGIPVS